MGLLKKITNCVLGNRAETESAKKSKTELLRRCYFEVMEQRRVLSADPVIAGVTYLEGDSGQDTTPDHFEVTFEGGADTTQLTQFVINGDQDNSGGLSDGDMFFDINDQTPGAGGHHDFQFDAANSSGVTSADILGISVSDDGTLLTVDVQNFESGDVLAFTIDVDEVERFRTDKIASGVEFEGSFFEATFEDENYVFVDKNVSINATLEEGYVQPQSEGIFYDEYNQLFSEGEQLVATDIDLTLDNEEGQSDRTAAAIDAYELEPKPITIAGTVYHDEDTDCHQDSTESGIAGVNIALELLNESTGNYQTVATTTTDANGNYEFGLDLDLKPGTYRLVESQPDGYLNVGAEAGSKGGVVEDNASGPNVIGEINVPLGGTAATNYDFCEVKPASIAGNVWHDVDDDGVFDSNEDGIANVLIQITRVGAKDGVANDPFTNTPPIFVRTDANGHYEVDSLPPGIYEVVEINNYPSNEVDPLATYIDGKDSVGKVGGTTLGAGSNDKVTQIVLCAGDEGVEYNFGELKPAQIGGYVSLTTPEGECLDPTDPNHVGIEGVSIELYDVDGNLVASTLTDADGRYEFNDLNPGTYSIVEIQPTNYLDAGEQLGRVDGLTKGILGEDNFQAIVLGSDSEGVMYNFCETPATELCGTVWHDSNDNGLIDNGEDRIGGVVIELFDGDGNKIAETVTDAEGKYCFKELYPGEYCVKEIQPVGYTDGKDSLGSVISPDAGSATVGELANDEFCKIYLTAGDKAVEYNFGELKPASISGMVHVDSNGDCVFTASEGDEPLAGVTIELLNEAGDVIATTLTDENGEYEFNDLKPGEYSIRESQPDNLFTGGEKVGDGGGEASENLLTGIKVGSGENLTEYDFCEHRPAEIHGRVWEDGPAIETIDGELPDNYRELRDGIYTAGTDTPLEGVRMYLYYYIDPTTEGIEPRAVTLGEVMAEDYAHMGTSDANAAVWVDTMADGGYWFTGLQAGNYIVLETQPDGYFDSNDTPGTTTGFTYNSAAAAATAPASLRIFSGEQLMDSVVNIRVNAGGISEANNFSEVRTTTDPGTPPPPVSPPPVQPPGNPITPQPGIAGLPGLFGSEPSAFTQYIGNSRGASFQSQAVATDPYTWHLSVVNGGIPRGEDDGIGNDSVWQQAGYISNADWSRFDMNQAVWSFTETRGIENEIIPTGNNLRFGMLGGTPLAGDFDGDGIDEVAVFKDGYWMIDLNRNGRWDDTDLLAKLGDSEDRPVVGDWDGDGKDDIGIYGPMWEHDLEAIERDPGLPNPENDPYTRPKNIPPIEEESARGARVMKLTSYGKQRADVVDHVFGTDDENLIPVTGDWNGNGIRSIGTFEDGLWRLDINGDGRFDHNDATARFGDVGDIPVVGDFNGDGVEEIAIYRAGTWMIDVNGNRELEATDKTFQMGGAADKPVVGDWDGDGTDDPGLYSEQQTPVY